MKEHFQKEAYEFVSLEDPAIARARKMKKFNKIIKLDQLVPEEEALPPFPEFPFTNGDCPAVHFIGDCENIVHWVNATRKCVDAKLSKIFDDVLNTFYEGWKTGIWRPRQPHLPFASWVRRGHNKIADALATLAIHNAAGVYFNDVGSRAPKYIQVFFDGGYRDGVTGAGLFVQAAQEIRNGTPAWYDVLRMSCRIDDSDKSNSLCAEAFGFLQAMRAVLSLVRHQKIVLDNNSFVLEDAPNYDGLQ